MVAAQRERESSIKENNVKMTEKSSNKRGRKSISVISPASIAKVNKEIMKLGRELGVGAVKFKRLQTSTIAHLIKHIVFYSLSAKH